jgi:hypothetical protein
VGRRPVSQRDGIVTDETVGLETAHSRGRFAPGVLCDASRKVNRRRLLVFLTIIPG